MDDISKKMGLNVELINFFDMGEEYYGKYDSIICSGVIEHLPNIKTKKQLNVLYNKIFSKFSKFSRFRKIIIDYERIPIS